MTRTYRAVDEYGRAVFGEHDFQADFTAVEERDHVDGGHLQIVPRPYEVLSDNYAGGKQGDVVKLALPVETEAALVFGGHLEPVDEEPVEKPAQKPVKKAAAKAAEKKE